MEVKELLEQAKQRYASAPSHAPLGTLIDAGSYCALSAIWATTDDLKVAAAAEDALSGACDADWFGVIEYNATHTTEEVLALYDLAIERVSA